MASTVWAARVDPTTPTRLEVQQFAADGTELESFYIAGVTGCDRLLAKGGTVAVINGDAFHTYNGSSVSTYSLPSGTYYGVRDAAINNGKFGALVRHPTLSNGVRYYEASDGVTWSLLSPTGGLFSHYFAMYRYRTAASAYVFLAKVSNETPDTAVTLTTNHVDFSSFPVDPYYSPDDDVFTPNGLLFTGSSQENFFYGPIASWFNDGPEIANFVVEVAGSNSPVTRTITGVPSGYDIVLEWIDPMYDYNGNISVVVTEEPTGGGDYVYGVYRKSGTTFARHRTFVIPDTGGPVVDITIYDATVYVTAEAGINGSFRIYDTVSTYTTISGDATYPWLAATIDSDSTATERFWVEEDDCIETTFSYS